MMIRLLSSRPRAPRLASSRQAAAPLILRSASSSSSSSSSGFFYFDVSVGGGAKQHSSDPPGLIRAHIAGGRGVDSSSNSSCRYVPLSPHKCGFIYQITRKLSDSSISPPPTTPNPAASLKLEIQKSLSKLDDLVANNQIESFCNDIKAFSDKHRDEGGKEILYKLNPMVEALAPSMNIQQILSVLSSLNHIDYKWSDSRCRSSIEVLVLTLSDILRKNAASLSVSNSNSNNSNSSSNYSSNSNKEISMEKSIAEAHCILGILRNLVEMKVNLKQLPKKKGYIDRFVDGVRQSMEVVINHDKQKERRFKVITKVIRDLGLIHLTFRDLPANFLNSVELIMSNNIGKGLMPDEACDYVFALSDLRASWPIMNADSRSLIENFITYFLPRLTSKDAAVLFYGLHKIECPFLLINKNTSNLVEQLCLRLFSGSNYLPVDFEAVSIVVYSLSVAGKDWNQLPASIREIIERYIYNSVSVNDKNSRFDKSSIGFFLYGLGELKCPLLALSPQLRSNVYTNILSSINSFGITELSYVSSGVGKSFSTSTSNTDLSVEVNEVSFALLKKFESLLLPDNAVWGGSESIESLGNILYGLGTLGRSFNELKNPQGFMTNLEGIISDYAFNSLFISTVTTANIVKGLSRFGFDWSMLSREFQNSLTKILNLSVIRADENYTVEILDGIQSIKFPLPAFDGNSLAESNNSISNSNHNIGFADPFVDSLLKTVHSFIYKSARPWGNSASFSKGVANLCYYVKDFSLLSPSMQTSVLEGMQKYSLSFTSGDLQLLLRGMASSGVSYSDLPASSQMALVTSLKRIMNEKKFSVEEFSVLFKNLSEFKIYWSDMPFDIKQSVSDRLAKLMINELAPDSGDDSTSSSKNVDSYVALLQAMGAFKMTSSSLRPSILMSLDFLTNKLLENSFVGLSSPSGDMTDETYLNTSDIHSYYSSMNKLLSGLASIKYKVSLSTADSIWDVLAKLGSQLEASTSLEVADASSSNSSSSSKKLRNSISSSSSSSNTNVDSNIALTTQSLFFTLGQLRATAREGDLFTINQIIRGIFRHSNSNSSNLDVRQLVIDMISNIYLLSTIHFPSFERLSKDVQDEFNDSLLLLSLRNLEYPTPSMMLLLPSLVRLNWQFPSSNSKKDSSEHKKLLLTVTEKLIPTLEMDEFATIVSSLLLLFNNDLGESFRSKLVLRLEDFTLANNINDENEGNISVEHRQNLAKLSVICDFVFSDLEKVDTKAGVFSYYKAFEKVDNRRSGKKSSSDSSSAAQFQNFVTNRLLETSEQNYNSDLIELLLSSKRK